MVFFGSPSLVKRASHRPVIATENREVVISLPSVIGMASTVISLWVGVSLSRMSRRLEIVVIGFATTVPVRQPTSMVITLAGDALGTVEGARYVTPPILIMAMGCGFHTRIITATGSIESHIVG